MPSPGVAVEVIMEEPGLIGSRYPAKVLQVTAGKAKVEIPAFDADEEGEEKLQEWVACALVTPPPPPAAKEGCLLLLCHSPKLGQ